jgi:hypothetical protein
MDKWKTIITDFHLLDHPGSPDSLHFGPPATAAEIAAFEAGIGFHFPEEFHDLYRSCNGFGRRDGEEIIWFCAPLEEIPALSEDVRKWFKGTHPELAAQFVAFIDWESGDYTGYVFDEEGKVLEGLFDFQHDSYDYESKQDPDEFLVPMFPTIGDLLEMS